MKPIQRSSWRLAFGVAYYRMKRRVRWFFARANLARTRDGKPYPYLYFRHQTPLLRKLKDVDMRLQHNKVHNLRLAVERLHGLVVQPGETFSYWRLIGKPTRRKGYREGMVLVQGRVGTGVGGGLCQLSNLIYWMTLHTPLTVTERHRHSYDVFPDANRTQPFGSGATCFYNYLDLQIENRTAQPFQLNIWLTDTHLVGEWRSTQPASLHYEVYEKEHLITPAIWGGYLRHNTLYRRIRDGSGTVVADEFVTENHAYMMYEPLLAAPGDGETGKPDQRR
ncbi:VanW family protein [Brevibacillus sp. SYP-B805]|uniref:VanW family protein n=1 Tax=Brevibacillus sp. SYP-B805 TaxID=1578199 RepID=UPI0013EAA84F|nr:VanW family protein [Brevibacillus sp. SYP-B805]NGQ96558.1 VanW family protein [Brevibacillus sp. SYP-B805]